MNKQHDGGKARAQMDWKSIKLEKPLFYNNDFGLRFEIGPPEMDIWADFDKGQLNSAYFDIAIQKAVSIFETVFEPTDDISIAYQIFSNRRRKIQKGNYLFKQISNIGQRKVSFTSHRNVYTADLYYRCQRWRRVMVSGMRVKDVNTHNLLLAMINTDFSCRHPSLRGDCFFINHTKGIVLNLYDDRGMDVIALERKALLGLYESHNESILDYDRERIDHVFSQVS